MGISSNPSSWPIFNTEVTVVWRQFRGFGERAVQADLAAASSGGSGGSTGQSSGGAGQRVVDVFA